LTLSVEAIQYQIDVTVVPLAYPVRDEAVAVALGPRLPERAWAGHPTLAEVHEAPTMRHCAAVSPLA
jgi:hypothetical protein